MTKKSIIWLSIVTFVLVLTGVLFGAVFCLRSQNVTVQGDGSISLSKSDIVSAAKLKNGQSIFLIDKQQAMANIEAKYAEIKVIQIKTTSLTEIEIVVRARHKMYYTEYNNNYYILDEDLKVMEIKLGSEEEPAEQPVNLIHIEKDVLKINDSTSVCDFVGSSEQKQIAYNLYTAMITTVTKTEGVGAEAKEVYYTRADVKETLIDVQFETYDTFNKIIITTKYGVQLDIENPTKDLQNKINICFSTIKEFLSDETTASKAESGIIKIYYELDGTQKSVYIPPVVET